MTNRSNASPVSRRGGSTNRDHGGLALLTLSALGVVYGDIGTSPLYAFREAFKVGGLDVTEQSILGVLSLIFWSLVLVVSIKYLLFVLRADNDGEGGILALTSLLIHSDQSKLNSRFVMIAVGVFGTALLYGDGMITPAISVLSAVEGLEVAVPALESWVLLIASAILVALFANQHRGTATLGSFFGPIMVLWFAIISVLGLIQIVSNPSVLAAINPFAALTFAFEQPGFAFLSLGGVFLVVTGTEALYADMGHFGPTPIKLGWFGLVFPALTINYFGQGALLLQDPTAIENPFYGLAPSWGVLPLVVLATAATVIASQALISGAYSLTSQAIQLGYLPRQRIHHTSSTRSGQIYVSGINWMLMISSVALVFAFRSSSNLAGAYGVGVATMMVITTMLLYVIMRDRWQWSNGKAVSLTALFLIFDVLFFAANITKIPAGGWFPLAVGILGFTLMTTWKRGRNLLAARLERSELPIQRFIESIIENPQQRVTGTAVYLHPVGGATPTSLLTNLRHHEVLHERIVLVTLEVSNRPRLPEAGRTKLIPLGEGFFQIVLTYGFMEHAHVPEALHNIVSRNFSFDETHATYFVGKETVLPSAVPGMKLWREHLYAFMHRNAESAALSFGLPPERVVEVGIQVPI
ncbi:MAG: potassium transporter Kup [Acidimicrobiia bacterium]|nr:potassium transporter Kup [Acidimicrobiia bacterium]